MPAPRFTAAQHQEWAEMREAGATYGEIARKYGCARSTVQLQCLTQGALSPGAPRVVPLTASNATRMSAGRLVRRFTQDEDDLILSLSAEGVSYYRIALHLPGRDRGAVRMRAIRLAMHQALAEAA